MLTNSYYIRVVENSLEDYTCGDAEDNKLQREVFFLKQNLWKPDNSNDN